MSNRIIEMGIFKPDLMMIKVTCPGCKKEWTLSRALAPRWLPNTPICAVCGYAYVIEYYERNQNVERTNEEGPGEE